MSERTDKIDAIRGQLSDLLKELAQLPTEPFSFALLVNDAMSYVIDLSRDLLHLRLADTIGSLRSAQSSLVSQAKALKADAEKIQRTAGEAAQAAQALAIAVEVAVAVLV